MSDRMAGACRIGLGLAAIGRPGSISLGHDRGSLAEPPDRYRQHRAALPWT